VQLALAGADVSLVARGAHLAAMRADGLKLLIGDEERVVHPRCTDNPAELGPQDFVIICLKAHSITGVIEAIQPLLARTPDCHAVNGFLTGTSTSTAMSARDRHLRVSTQADGNGANGSGARHRVHRYPATEIERPASSAISMATLLSAKPPEKKARMSNGSPRCSSAGLQRPCSIGSVTKYGSNCGACLFQSISALTTQRWKDLHRSGQRAPCRSMMLETQSIAETSA